MSAVSCVKWWISHAGGNLEIRGVGKLLMADATDLTAAAFDKVPWPRIPTIKRLPNKNVRVTINGALSDRVPAVPCQLLADCSSIQLYRSGMAYADDQQL